MTVIPKRQPNGGYHRSTTVILPLAIVVGGVLGFLPPIEHVLGERIPGGVLAIGLAARGDPENAVARLREKVERVESGATDVDFSIDRDDEIGKLYESIEGMVDSMREHERELDRYRRYTDDVLDAIDDVFYVLDADGEVIRWNESLCAVTGYADAEIASMHALDFFDENDHEAVADAIQNVERHEGDPLEAAVRTKDGESIPFEFVASTLEDPEGEQVIAGIGRDISKRKRIERQRTRLIENIPGVVYRARNERDWPMEFVSEGVTEITGYDPGALERGEVEWGEDVIARGNETLWEEVQERLGERNSFTVTYPIETADGERRWLKEQGRGVFAEDGSVEALEGVMIDVTVRIERERELERTRHLLEQSQRLAQVGAWELELHGGTVSEVIWTDEVYRIHDLSPEEDLDLDGAIEFYHPDDRQRIREAVEGAIARGESYDEEARLITASGNERWVRAIGEPVFEDDEVVRVRGSVQDITDAKEREEELRETKNSRNAVIEASPAAIIAIDTDGVVELWNPAAERMFGWSREEAVGGRLPIIPEDRRSEFEGIRSRLLVGESISGLETKRRAKDGSVIDVSLSAAPLRGDDGEIIGVMGALQDITDRKEREQELERTRELLQQAQRIAEVGGWELDLTSEPPSMTWTDELYRLHELSRGADIDVETVLELYHPDDRSYMRDRFEAAIERGESYDMEVRALTPGKGQRWVRAIGEPVYEDGEVVRVRGSIQDVTEEKERELALQSLHETARQLLGAETEADVAELVVETAEEILGGPGVSVYLLDSEANRLEPVAVTDRFADLCAGSASVGVDHGDSVLWNSFVTGSQTVLDQGAAGTAPGIFGDEVEGGLLVPLGDHGVFAVATSAATIGEETRRIVETIAATAEAAFDRLESEANLTERDAELQTRNRRLRRQMQINEIIRTVGQSLIVASSRNDIEWTVCERLVEAEDIAFAWIGAIDAAGAEMVPRAWAGTGQKYLDAIPLEAFDSSSEPALTTARTEIPAVVENVVDRLKREEWRKRALASDFHSVVSVPLSFDEYSYGVLSVYANDPNAFGDLERTVFAELGESIASAINAVRTRQALHSDTLVELTLRLTESDTFLARIARATDRTVEYEGLAAQSVDETQLFFSIDGGDADAVRAALADLVSVSEYRQVSESDDSALFEATVSGETLPSRLVRHGANPRSIRATGSELDVVVDLPTSVDVREFVEMLEDRYGAVELVGRRDVDRAMHTRQEVISTLFEDLTDRQIEVLRTAYFAGFFDWPRESTGEDVADMLEVSQPTVNRHLRLAQRRLLGQLFEDEIPALVT